MASRRSDLDQTQDMLNRMKTNGNDDDDYTTYGRPETYTGEDGATYSGDHIDEGNLSAKHFVEKKGPYVTVLEATDKFPAGFKLYTTGKSLKQDKSGNVIDE